MKVNEDLSILFWLKRQKASQDGLVSIWVRITINGKRDGFSSGKKIHPDAWDEKAAITGINCPDYKLINSYVAKTRVELEKHYNQLAAVSKRVTATMVKDAYMPKQILQKTLLQAFKLHMRSFQKELARIKAARGLWLVMSD